MKGSLLSFSVVGILFFGLGVGDGRKTNLPPKGERNNKVLKPGLTPSNTQEAFGVILAKTPDEIDQVDTATLNWACLGGLPRSQTIDLSQAQARIRKIADVVKASTKASLELNRKQDKSFQESPQFRIAMLSYVLQQDYKPAHFAEQYDPDAWKFTDWGKTRPEDLLFQSAMNDRRDPVFSNAVWFVAVGQDPELKYPLKLASIPGRLCAVWDDGKNRWFILPTPEGVEVFTEDQVRKEYPVPDKDIKEQNLYHEYTQSEVLAVFLQIRGKYLDQKEIPEHSALAYAAAHRFSPNTPLFSENLESAVDSATESNSVERRTVETSSPERFLSPPATPVKDLTP
jgi:hypothetical protein